jgi:protein O-GlcNAc transferase
MSVAAPLDQARQQAFIGRVLEHASGTMTTLLAVIGDRLGLFKNLAEHGPSTAREFAERTALNERYVREWALAQAANGYITFGCLNNFSKVNITVLTAWIQILAQVANSRLVLYAPQGRCRQRLENLVSPHDIDPHRLQFVDLVFPVERYLEQYQRIDIALDPFPYPGGTTSVEALWMGVPVITRRGDRFLSHMGETIAHNAGLPDWIAADADEYVAKADEHSADLERLAKLRATLRQQVLASPVFDAPRFARNFETAVWGMWQTWRDKQIKGNA